MILNACILASVTLVAGVFLFLRLPIWLQRLMFRFSVATDVTFSIGCYFFFGGSATALLAAGLLGLFVSAAFTLCHRLGIEPQKPLKPLARAKPIQPYRSRYATRQVVDGILGALTVGLGAAYRALNQLQARRASAHRLLPAAGKSLPPTGDGPN